MLKKNPKNFKISKKKLKEPINTSGKKFQNFSIKCRQDNSKKIENQRQLKP